MSRHFCAVAPIKPIAPYLGGKSKLAETIIALINQIPHETYAEPFVGMGGIFLRRSLRPKSEVINDYSRDLITLFRILQRHYPQFLDTLKFQISSRAAFDRLKDTDPDTLTDLERAARFLYLQKQSYGGKVGGTFGVQVAMPARFDLSKIEPLLNDLHERLNSVLIECKPYHEFIDIYDRPETLFYLDPQYWGNEKDYGKDCFAREDFTRLRQILRDIDGTFIMSLNDLPEVQDHFAEFHLETLRTTYSIAVGGHKEVSELLISNVRLDQRPVQAGLF